MICDEGELILSLERLSLTLRGLTSNGKDPSLNHIKIEKCLLLFATNTNISTIVFKELKTVGKSFIFAVCRLTEHHVTSSLNSLLSTPLIKPNYVVILPPTQHRSSFRNLPPSFVQKLAVSVDTVHHGLCYSLDFFASFLHYS